MREGLSRLVLSTVYKTPNVRSEKTIAETSLQGVEQTQRVARPPSSASASQPKGPTNTTTRIGIGKESSRCVNTRAAKDVAQSRLAPQIA